MNFAIPGRPITKKNSQRLVKRGKRMVPIPSARLWNVGVSTVL